MERREDRLINIPIEVAPCASDTGSLGGTVVPILNELLAMLDALSAHGETNSIDLRRAPLGPEDLTALKKMLGQGEVSAELQSLGSTRIYETAVSGVWWITHCNQDDKLLGEFIEVTSCPDLLKTHPEDLRSGSTRLRSRLSEEACAPSPSAIAQRLKAMGLEQTDMCTHPGLDQLKKGSHGNAG